MGTNNFESVKFIPRGDREFGVTVRKRVNEYFKSNGISKRGDYRIWIKVIVMPLLFITPFVLIVSNLYNESYFLFYGLWVLMGFGMAGCGLGIMHDACHGAISKKESVNHIIGLVLNVAGGSSFNWKIQHNVLHHSFTNIDGYDEDIDPSGVMRFSPHQKHKKIFKYQVYYAWIFYGLMTFFWVTYKDFASLIRYEKRGLLKAQNASFNIELSKLILHKVLYYSIILGLPIILLDIAWWHILLGWFSMHFVCGVILACIFQSAHVVPSSEYPLPDQENKVEGDFAVHQMKTTANFAPGNRLLSWYVGGLNYQIEHHLFPNMCHIHHREVSKIVKKTAQEFSLPYISQPTFFGALFKHLRLLHTLGQGNQEK